MKNHNLPNYMEEERVKIEQYAKEMGLSFFQTVFQLLHYEEMNMVAAYGGFPNRYPHWSFGMDYEQVRKPYIYGFSNIYEMVVNTDPCYAYLLDCNNMTQQKAVMAHVYSHADFFKNNYRFAYTNRKMIDEMANHATKVRKYIDKYGIDQVENFIDTCHVLMNLVDTDAVYMANQEQQKKKGGRDQGPGKFKVDRRYMDSYINPEEELEKQKRKMRQETRKMKRFPSEPERDVLKFLLNHAPLANWQKTILDIVREERYYFAPQGETKILNEGWACFCHSRIMTQKALKPSEIVDYADFHSGPTSQQPGRLNPYALGLSLLLDIEERWNKGRHGREYEECGDMAKKLSWDTGEGKGLEKVFEVRKNYSDITFLDEFLTPEFCVKNKLATFSRHELEEWGTAIWTIDSKKFKDVKEKLLFSLTNMGSPFIYLTDANYRNRGELLLHHKWLGAPLDFDWAESTLQRLEELWKRPVNLETLIDDEWGIINCTLGEIDYQDIEEEDLSYKY